MVRIFVRYKRRLSRKIQPPKPVSERIAELSVNPVVKLRRHWSSPGWRLRFPVGYATSSAEISGPPRNGPYWTVAATKMCPNTLGYWLSALPSASPCSKKAISSGERVTSPHPRESSRSGIFFGPIRGKTGNG
jgi:hypothetical protein